MFCRQCGTQIADGSAFCPKCGAKQAADDTAGQAKKKSGKLPIILGCGAVVLIIVVVLIVIFMRGEESYDAAAEEDQEEDRADAAGESIDFWEAFRAGEEEEDSAAADDEAAASDESTAEDAEAADEDYLVYAEALWNIMSYNVLPDGRSANDMDGFIDSMWDRFAICDINQDGAAELLINIESGSMAGNAQYVYRADPYADGLELIHAFTNYTTYYDTGVIKEDWSHNQGLSMNFWPYNVLQWDADGCRDVGWADAWEKEFWETDYSGNAFPDQVDADGNGMVYFIGGENEIDYDNPVDDSEYNAFVNKFFEGANEVYVPWLSITAENIETATGYSAPIDSYELSGAYEGSAEQSILSISIYSSQEEGEIAVGNASIYEGDVLRYHGLLIPGEEKDVYWVETDTEEEVMLAASVSDGIIIMRLYVDGQYADEYRMVEHYVS